MVPLFPLPPPLSYTSYSHELWTGAPERSLRSGEGEEIEKQVFEEEEAIQEKERGKRWMGWGEGELPRHKDSHYVRSVSLTLSRCVACAAAERKKYGIGLGGRICKM